MNHPLKFMILTALIAVPALAQTSGSDAAAGAGAPASQDKIASLSGIVRQNGNVYFFKDGRSQKVEKELQLSEGINVQSDGRVTFKDGTKMTLKDGQMVTLDGKIMTVPEGIGSKATVTVPKGASGSDTSGNGAIGAGAAGGGASVSGSEKERAR